MLHVHISLLDTGSSGYFLPVQTQWLDLLTQNQSCGQTRQTHVIYLPPPLSLSFSVIAEFLLSLLCKREELFYTLLLTLKAERRLDALCCRCDVFTSYLLTIFPPEAAGKKSCKTSSFFTKTINHFQVHGSSIRRRSPVFF